MRIKTFDLHIHSVVLCLRSYRAPGTVLILYIAKHFKVAVEVNKEAL